MSIGKALLQFFGGSLQEDDLVPPFDATAAAESVFGRETVARVQAELAYRHEKQRAASGVRIKGERAGESLAELVQGDPDERAQAYEFGRRDREALPGPPTWAEGITLRD